MKLTKREVLEMLDETVNYLNGYKIYMEYDYTNYYSEESSQESLKGLYINVDDKRLYGSLHFELVYKNEGREDTQLLVGEEIKEFLDNIFGSINQYLKENTKELSKNIEKFNKDSEFKTNLEFLKLMRHSIVDNTELIIKQYE